MTKPKKPAPKRPVGRPRKSEVIERESRARYYLARAVAAEADNAKKSGELMHPDVIERALAKVVAEIVAGLNALPSQIKVEIPHLRAAEVTLVRNRIARLRNALSNIEISSTDLR